MLVMFDGFVCICVCLFVCLFVCLQLIVVWYPDVSLMLDGLIDGYRSGAAVDVNMTYTSLKPDSDVVKKAMAALKARFL